MIEKIKIQNFKSLKDVELKLGKVNLLIGPNNSGKSNLLKALEFFGNCFNGRYDKTVDKKNVFAGENGNAFSAIHLDFEDNIKCSYKIKQELFDRDWQSDEPSLADYSFIMHDYSNLNPYPYSDIFSRVDLFEHSNKFYFISDVGVTNSDYTQKFNQIVEESGIQGYRKTMGKAGSKYTGITVFNNQREKYSDSHVPISPGRLIKENALQIFDELKIYKPDPTLLYKPLNLAGVNRNIVDYNASNLVAFLDNLQGSHRKSFEDIQEDFRICINDFDEVLLGFADSKPSIVLKKLGLRDIRGNVFWSDELSDGTLYFLALLAIIHQPNPRKLLLLEEPENNIHPRRINDVIEYIFKLADDKDIQVIMTTHSPIVVDKFRDLPESVHIFDMEDGETNVMNLTEVISENIKDSKKAKIEPIDLRDDLGENWILGLLGGTPNVNY